MIDTTKVKLMTKVAMYEKKAGKEDFRIHRSKESTYIAMQLIESLICITIAYLLGAALFCLHFLNNFAVEGLHSFKMPLALIVLVYICVLALGLVVTWFVSRRKYRAAHRRILRYDRNLERLDQYNKNKG